MFHKLRLATFLSIAFIINVGLFFLTSYAENHWFNRTMFCTFAIYCFFLALTGTLFINKNLWSGITAFISLMTYGLCLALILFLTMGITTNTFIGFVLMTALYGLITVFLLWKQYHVIVSVRLWIDTMLSALFILGMMLLPDNFDKHYYGFQLTLSTISLSLYILIFRHSRFACREKTTASQ